jgi:hypothetical protein
VPAGGFTRNSSKLGVFSERNAPMKTIAISLLAALLAALSLAACATDEDATPDQRGLRPGYKPPIEMRADNDDRPDIDESFEIGSPPSEGPLVDDGRVMWVEVIESEEQRITQLHHFDSETGIDLIEILDEDGVVQRTLETRFHATEISVGARH